MLLKQTRNYIHLYLLNNRYIHIATGRFRHGSGTLLHVYNGLHKQLVKGVPHKLLVQSSSALALQQNHMDNSYSNNTDGRKDVLNRKCIVRFLLELFITWQHVPESKQKEHFVGGTIWLSFNAGISCQVFNVSMQVLLNYEYLNIVEAIVT